MPDLKACQLSRQFGSRPGLQGLDFELRQGSLTLLSGPSGSGKSTLVNLLALIDRPDTGHIAADGTPVSGLPEGPRAAWRGRHVGVVFQHHLLPDGATCVDAVADPLLWTRGMTLGDARDTAREQLRSVGLIDREGETVRFLSGGERQRLALARVLALRPPIVLADEPTAQLDRDNATLIVDLLLRATADTGATLFVVSHEADTQQWPAGARRWRLEGGRLGAGN